jgi:hypothetical protein
LKELRQAMALTKLAFDKIDNFAKSDWWDDANVQEREAINEALLRLSRSKRAVSNLISVVENGFERRTHNA